MEVGGFVSEAEELGREQMELERMEAELVVKMKQTTTAEEAAFRRYENAM